MKIMIVLVLLIIAWPGSIENDEQTSILELVQLWGNEDAKFDILNTLKDLVMGTKYTDFIHSWQALDIPVRANVQGAFSQYFDQKVVWTLRNDRKFVVFRTSLFSKYWVGPKPTIDSAFQLNTSANHAIISE